MTVSASHLVVHPGCRVSGVGRLTRLVVDAPDRRVDLAWVGVESSYNFSSILSTLSPQVFVLLGGPPSLHSCAEGTLVRVEGVWDGESQISLDTANPADLGQSGVLREATASAVPTGKDTAGVPIWDLLPPPAMQAADRLRDSGALLSLTWRGTTQDQLTWHATAFEENQVRDALAPYLSPRLQISASRWSAAELAEANAVVMAIDSELCAFGSRRTDDGQEVVTAVLSHVSPSIAWALDALPEGIVEIEAILHPAELPPRSTIIE